MRHRRFVALRQAYMPRMWPWVLLAMGLAATWGALTFALLPSWLAVPLCFLGGVVCGSIPRWRFMYWLRRHPQMSLQEYMRTIRETAPWN